MMVKRRMNASMSGALGGTLLAFTAMTSPALAQDRATAANTAEVVKDAGPKTRFVLQCYDRAFRGDPKVYDDCFTPDYVMRGPETRMVSNEPDGGLHGRSAIQAYHDMNHGDAKAWKDVEFKTVWSLESGDKVIRMMRGIYSKPEGSYAGIDNIPPDRVVTINGIFVDTLRNGKIADQFFAYDTMGFITDIAGGDMHKVATAMIKMGDMMKAARQAQKDGNPFPAKPPAQ